MNELLRFLKNRKKPILGLIAGGLVYAAAKLGFDLDPEVAATISAVIFAVVVERSHPVFGDDAETPIIRRRR